MNCNEYSLRYWDKLLEGGFVITWNKEYRYKKIDTRKFKKWK